MRLSIMIVPALLLTLSATAADKTKGLPEAGAGAPPEVNDSVMREAKTKLGVAQGNVERAQQAMATVIADLKKKAEASPDVAAAQQAAKQAQYEYEAATGPVLERTRAGRDYQNALDAKQAAATKVTALQAESGTQQSEITEAARVVLEKGKVCTQIEVAALAANPQIVLLKSKLDAANVALLKARRDADLATRSAPELTAAKADLERAQAEIPRLQAAYNVARERYNADVAARERAMNTTKSNTTEEGAGKKYMKKKKV